MALSPLGTSPFIASPGRIIVKPWNPQLGLNVSLPDSFKQSDQIGEVIAVGPSDISLYSDKVTIETAVKVGDIVWHSPYLHEPYTHFADGIRYRSVKFGEINAILIVAGEGKDAK